MFRRTGFLIFFFLLFCALPTAASEKIRIVVLGDSLTEGYGVDQDKAFPSLVEKDLNERSYSVRVINSGISGSTSAGATSRMKWILKSKPDIIFLALGANDGLRGLNSENLKKNLVDSIKLGQEAGATVILAGMKMPTNYGQDYRASFEEAYTSAAKETETPLMPFLLEGVAAQKEFNIQDGIHPNEAGHKIIAKNVADFLIPWLKK